MRTVDRIHHGANAVPSLVDATTNCQAQPPTLHLHRKALVLYRARPQSNVAAQMSEARERARGGESAGTSASHFRRTFTCRLFISARGWVVRAMELLGLSIPRF
jgi:hypothetical protein